MTEAGHHPQAPTVEQRALLDASVTARIADVARRQPRAPAARAEGVELDFEGLERRSNAAGRVLHERFGPGAEAICLWGVTGTDMAVLPLAVVKSGRPYIWVQADLPLPRVRQILERSRAVGIVGTVQDELADAVDPFPVLDLGSTGEADEPPAVEHRPEDPVSILFTSGSTGVPKGVVTPHRYYTAAAVTYADRPVGAGHRVAQVVPMSFGYGNVIFLRTLLLGGTLLFFDPKATGLLGLGDWLEDERAEVLEATPSHLRALVRTLGPGRVLPDLRMVDTAGEPLYARDVTLLEEHVGEGCDIGNILGTSEVGGFCRYRVPRGVSRRGIVPVGTPEALFEVDLLDGHGRAVPEGEPGEFVVTCRRGSLGYWAQPEQTAARLTTLDDGRVRYRTGDLGRRQDGTFVHLGRADGMVKVRGCLVEPAEVEAGLLDTGLVRECAVLGRVAEGEGGSITAFVVPVAGGRVSVAAVRRSLRQRLPEYMVPSAIGLVEELPRSPHGKIDRLALAALPAPAARTSDVRPRTPLEHAVWGIFSETLGLDHFGVDDDFFALGGDSLAAEELVTALRTEYGATVDTADLASAPTVAGLAERSHWSGSRPSACVTLRAEGDLPPLFCVAGGGSLAIAFVPLVRHLDPGRPVHALQDPAILGAGLPAWSVREVARRHLREVRALQPEGPYYLAGHSAGGVIAWEMAQQLARAGQHVGLLVLIDTLRSSAGQTVRQELFGSAGNPGGSRWSARRMARLAGDVWRITRASLRPDRQGSTPYELFFRHTEILLRRYRPRPWGGPTVVFLASSSEARGDTFDWAGLLTGPVEIRHRPGNHVSIFREPHAEGLARELEEALRREQGVAVGAG